MDKSVGRLLVASFILGVRASDQANGRVPGSTPEERLLDVLLAIRSGELTLEPSPAEVRSEFPSREVVEESHRRNRSVERQLVECLIAEFLGRGPTA